MRPPILLFALLLSASLGWAQHNSLTGQHQADKAEDQFEKTVPPPIHQQSSIDFAKLKSAADELVILSQSIHSVVEARLLLGRLYLGLKNPVAAEDRFESALLLRSGSVGAQLGIADAQTTKGNFAEAVQSLEALSKAQPKNAHVFDLLAKAYSGLGKKTEAQQAEVRAKLLSSNK
jgi:predicted Zn-dependent protease